MPWFDLLPLLRSYLKNNQGFVHIVDFIDYVLEKKIERNGILLWRNGKDVLEDLKLLKRFGIVYFDGCYVHLKWR